MRTMREREASIQARLFDLDDGLERLEMLAEIREQQVVAEAEAEEVRTVGLSASDLEQLPSHIHAADDGAEDSDAEDCCAICIMEYEPGQRLCTLQCDGQHKFHESCVHQWLAVSQLCPLCKSHSLGSAIAAGVPEPTVPRPEVAPLRRALAEAQAEAEAEAAEAGAQHARSRARQTQVEQVHARVQQAQAQAAALAAQAGSLAAQAAARAQQAAQTAAQATALVGAPQLPIRANIPARLTRIAAQLPPHAAAIYTGAQAEDEQPQPPRPRASFARPLLGEGTSAAPRPPSHRRPTATSSSAAPAQPPSLRTATRPTGRRRHEEIRRQQPERQQPEPRVRAQATAPAAAPPTMMAQNSAAEPASTATAAAGRAAAAARSKRSPVSRFGPLPASAEGFVKVRSAELAVDAPPQMRKARQTRARVDSTSLRPGSAALLGTLGVPVPQAVPTSTSGGCARLHGGAGSAPASRGGSRPLRARLELQGRRLTST